MESPWPRSHGPCTRRSWERGETLSRRWGPKALREGLPAPRGGGCVHLVQLTRGRFAEIPIPWAKAESRAEGCVPTGGRREMPSAGWSCLNPAEAPAPLRAPRPLMSPCIAAGTTGTFPVPVSPVNSCCDVPSFLLSLSRCCWALFNSVRYDSCLLVAANGGAHKIKHGPLPLPGGRQTIPVSLWRQLKLCEASAQLIFDG